MAEIKTGLPDGLKSEVEKLCGRNLDHVQVHYNSPLPAQLNALAWSGGNHMHVGPGLEKHLPHEAWHVVQQQQGRVPPSLRSHIGLSTSEQTLEVERTLLAKRTPL